MVSRGKHEAGGKGGEEGKANYEKEQRLEY